MTKDRVSIKTPRFLLAASTKANRLLPQAIHESWTAARLAAAAGVSRDTAHKLINQQRAVIRDEAHKAIAKPVHRLVREAQTAKDAALRHLQELRELTAMSLEHVKASAPQNGKSGVPLALDEFGLPLPFDSATFVKSAATAGKMARDLLKFADEVTGVDVVKQITVRTQSDKEGKLVSWDGVESLESAHESGILKDEPLQLSDSADHDDSWLE